MRRRRVTLCYFPNRGAVQNIHPSPAATVAILIRNHAQDGPPPFPLPTVPAENAHP